MKRSSIAIILLFTTISMPSYAQNNWDLKDNPEFVVYPKDIKCPIEHLYNDITVKHIYELQRKHNPFPTEEIFEIQFDVDQDGHNDSLITTNFMLNGRQGEQWSIYFKRPTGYTRIGPWVTFNQYSYSLNKHPDKKAAILTRFSTAGGEEGSQIETIITTTSHQSQKLHEFQWWQDEDSAKENLAFMNKLHEEHKKSMKKYPVTKMLFSDVENHLKNECEHKIFDKPKEETP